MDLRIKRTLINSTLLIYLSLGMGYLSLAQKKSDLAQTPPMGWNSWNWFGKKNIDENVIKEVIDAMVSEGLRDAGYNYVIIDGGWRDTKLGPDGELLAHPVKFPNGIKPLAAYAHSKGMKLGVHVVPGTHDCGGDLVGAVGVEEIHLKQFIDWELDFIKLDQCKFVDDPCIECPKTKLGWSEGNVEKIYKRWGALFKESERDVFFNISGYVYRDWYPDVCHSARTTLDIQSRIHNGGGFFNPLKEQKMAHKSVMHIANKNNKYAEFAGPGYWNDPDMLIIGDHGLSEQEQESHFALWCIMTSPLMLGNNPMKMTEFEKKLILNKEMISINQDATEQGKIIKEEGDTQIWAKKLQNGDMAVLLLNLDKSCEQRVSVNLAELGIEGKGKIREVQAKKSLGNQKRLKASLKPHQSKLYLVSK